MTAHITFFPLGNADTSLIRLADSQLVLLDYANKRDPVGQGSVSPILHVFYVERSLFPSWEFKGGERKIVRLNAIHSILPIL